MTFERAASRRAELRESLAEIEGLALSESVDLSRQTTFRIGGRAEFFVEARSEPALSALLGFVDSAQIPFFLLGIGSNVLVPDAGLDGVVAKLGGDLSSIAIDGTRVIAGGGASLPKLARQTVRQGLVGLEALAGFPSTIGGAVRMNAGSYGTEIRDVLVSARVVDRRGRVRTVAVEDLGAGYRTTLLQSTGEIVTRAQFELREGDSAVATRRIRELNERRWQSLPSGSPHVGSIFRNPEISSAGRLIDECGLKGLISGGAQVSLEHGNVIVNLGSGTASDVLDLMIKVYVAVAEKFAVSLEPEVVLLGSLAEEWESATQPARRRVKAADSPRVP